MLRKKWRYTIACLLCIVIVLSYYYPTHNISKSIVSVVTSTNDFAFVQEIFPQEPIKISVFQKGQQPLMQFTSLKEVDDGVVLTYDQPFTITAHEDGVVIYTGHTASGGKTLIVAYENKMTVTYRYIDTIFPLPYTKVFAGEAIAKITNGRLHVNVMQENQMLSEQEIRNWLNNAP